jgi:hypothetical protein
MAGLSFKATHVVPFTTDSYSRDLVKLAFGETCILSDDVELPTRWLDGLFGNVVTRAVVVLKKYPSRVKAIACGLLSGWAAGAMRVSHTV